LTYAAASGLLRCYAYLAERKTEIQQTAGHEGQGLWLRGALKKPVFLTNRYGFLKARQVMTEAGFFIDIAKSYGLN
jgi:hypothetical protein